MRRVMLVASLGLVIVSVFFLALSVSRSLEQRQQAAVVAAVQTGMDALVAGGPGAPTFSGGVPSAVAVAPGAGGADATGGMGDRIVALAGRLPFASRWVTPSGTMDLPSQVPPPDAIVGAGTASPPAAPVAGGLPGATAALAGGACPSPQDVQTLVAQKVQEALNARPAPFDWRTDMTPLVQNALVPLIGALAGLLGALAQLRKRT